MPPNAYQRILRKTVTQHIPLSAHWELTYRCGLSCRHCYAPASGPGDELSTAELSDGLEQLAGLGCLFLAFTGGEIFCRADLWAIVAAAAANGFALRLLTSGIHVDTGAADRLAALGLLGIDISLYAMTPDVHDSITGVPGSHQRTVAAIRCCRDRDLPVTVKTVLTTLNVNEFDAIAEFAKSVTAAFTYDFVLVPAADGTDRMGRYGLSEQDIYEFLRERAMPTGIDPVAPQPTDALCGVGSSAICINPYGDVYPCLAVRESLGNLRTQSLREIWQSPQLVGLRDARYCDLVGCMDCDVAGYCTRCSGVALSECGNVLAPSPAACTAARATKRVYDEVTLTESEQ